MKIHRKPTIPFGSFELVGDKFVEMVGSLPEIKEFQELELMKKFVVVFNSKVGELSDLRQLSFDDHDFELKQNAQDIVIQLTEISLRGIGWKVGGGYFIPNIQDENILLRNAIVRKVEKQYQKPASKKFWLLVFQTDTPSGMREETIELAREYLVTLQNLPFDEVWYFHLYADDPEGMIKKVWPFG